MGQSRVGSFDDYLASLRSKRRNQVRRERRELAEQGVTIETLVGEAIPMELAPLAYRLYRTTVDTNPWGQRYLNERLFAVLFERWRGRLCLVLARCGGEVIAGTVQRPARRRVLRALLGRVPTAAAPALQRQLLCRRSNTASPRG